MESKRTLRNQQITDFVFAAILAAITIMMIFIPGLGFITIGPISITIVHIPVLIGAVILGKKYGLLLGTIFGVGSMIMAYVNIITDAPFTNPLVSVVPRMIFGYLIVFIYDGFNKYIKNKYISVPITMGVATLVHSLMVLPILYFVWKSGFFINPNNAFIYALEEKLFPYIYGAFVGSSIFEIIMAIIIGSAVTIPLLHIKERQE